MKTTVGVIFGGKSVEHEVSVISASQAIMSFDYEKYNVVPIYLTKDNRFFVGDRLYDVMNFKDIDALLAASDEVTMHKGERGVELIPVKRRLLGKRVLAVIDVFLPIVHGTNVEDGTLQGFLELLGAPYCGCDVTASALGMDKFAMKTMLKENGINVLDAVCVYSKEYFKEPEKTLDMIEEKIGYPVIIKPVNLGSSVGIKKASDRKTLAKAMELATGFSERVLAEHAINELREINCAVLGDYESTRTGTLEEPLGGDEILSYQDKYMSGAKSSAKGGAKTSDGSKGMSGAKRKIPAELSPAEEKKIREIAQAAFRAINANGVTRVDLMIDKSNGEIYVNEVNTIPGSLSFYLWEREGLSFAALLDELINLAWKRERERSALTFSNDVNLLATLGSFGGVKGAKGGVKDKL